MEKPVKAVLATVRGMIGVMSQSKLPDELMRLTLMQVLTDYQNTMLAKYDDRFLRDIFCRLTLDYQTGDYQVRIRDEFGGNTQDFTPQYLYYTQGGGSSQSRYKIYLSNLDNYARDASLREGYQGVGAFYGNNYDGGGLRLRLSINESLAGTLNWRMVLKRVVGYLLDWSEPVPFPSNHINLIESTLAYRILDLVNDVSPDWQIKYGRLKNAFAGLIEEQRYNFLKWQEGDPKALLRPLPMYSSGQGRRGGNSQSAQNRFHPVEE